MKIKGARAEKIKTRSRRTAIKKTYLEVAIECGANEMIKPKFLTREFIARYKELGYGF